MKRKVIKKIKNRCGMTLVELLVATMILLLATQGMASGFQLAQRQFVQSIRRSEAQELYSTLETIISSDLRYTTTVYIAADDTVYYRSQRFASGHENGDTILVDNNGRVLIGNPSANEYRIVDDTAYTRGLEVSLDEFKYSADKKMFTVKLRITANGTTYAEGSFEVRGLSL